MLGGMSILIYYLFKKLAWKIMLDKLKNKVFTKIKNFGYFKSLLLIISPFIFCF